MNLKPRPIGRGFFMHKKGASFEAPNEIYKPDSVPSSIARLWILSFIYATYPPSRASSPFIHRNEQPGFTWSYSLQGLPNA